MVLPRFVSAVSGSAAAILLLPALPGDDREFPYNVRMIVRPIAVVVVAASIGVHLTTRLVAQNTSGVPLRVLVSNGMKGSMEELRSQCEKAVGRPLALTFDSTASLKKRIEAGEAFDATIITTEAIDDLIKQGRLSSASRTDVGRSELGIGIRAGAPRPDIRTPAALKKTLLDAKSITYPKDGASRGAIEKMFDAMGITADVRPRIILAPGSGPATESVATGKAAMVITLFSEIVPVRGVEILGPLPGDYQLAIRFAAAASATSKNSEAARALIAFVAGAEAAPVLKAKGIEPRAASGGADWPSANYDQSANRYSPLTQITAANVRTLQQVWSFHLKPAGFTGPMKEDEAIPIVIGNTMYLGSPYGAVIALDATTGSEKWRFQLPGNELPAKRGVAYWPGGGDLPFPPSIVFGSTVGRLYSLKAADGTLNEWFGENGVITLKTPEVMQTGTDAAYSLLSAPTIYKNLIITGAGTGEGPGGSNAGSGPAGDTRAWDARSGKLVWTFHTVPRRGDFGYDTWGGDSARNRSGVNVWGYTSLDADRGILYMPLGAPNNDRVGIDRPGNNLFSSSVVAVDANTGKYLWHFQVVHHDIWDYDTQSAPLLVDLRRDGQVVPAVIIVNKTGLMFTLNRVTGKPIFEIEERPVPKSDVPGEQASPTQPFPIKPEPLTQNTISRNNLYKGEPQHQSYCEHLVDDNNMKLGGPYMPIAFNQYSISPPGPAGGINFWGASYDPELHLFVSNTSNIFQPMRIVQRADGSYANSGPLAGTRRFGDPDRKLLCGPTPWGELVAVNMDTGDVAYRRTLGVSDALPAGLQDTGRPSSGGVVLTASGLTFVGGTDDFRFRAFATATGERLWEIKLPSSVETTPITYLGADGRQFVTVVSTGGGLTGSQVTNDEIIAFALPKK
jgi:quinoprotein glucose dehydrogenase